MDNTPETFQPIRLQCNPQHTPTLTHTVIRVSIPERTLHWCIGYPFTLTKYMSNPNASHKSTLNKGYMPGRGGVFQWFSISLSSCLFCESGLLDWFPSVRSGSAHRLVDLAPDWLDVFRGLHEKRPSMLSVILPEWTLSCVDLCTLSVLIDVMEGCGL